MTKKTRISEFTLQGQDFQVLFDHGQLSYVFEINGNRYGNAVKVDTRKTRDVVDACVCLLNNLIETREAAQKHDKRV